MPRLDTGDAMTNQSSETLLYYDELVIRLRRQLAWDDLNALPAGLGSTRPEGKNIFQAEVRQTPWPMQGGAFHVDVENQLAEFQNFFELQAKSSRKFYNYANPPGQGTLLAEVAGDELAGLGSKLYQLLPLSLQLALPGLIQSTFERGRGIRLILEARAGDQADRLLSLPWELLFFKATGVYPARTPRLLVVRRVLDAVRQNPLKLVAPLNLVHVIADDQAAPIDPGLQATECTALRHAIGEGNYTLLTKPGSFERLIAALQTQRANIVHFLGHGDQQNFSEHTKQTGGRGYLCFIGENHQQEWISGEQLQHVLSNTPGVQLVVLNACHGGSAVAARNVAHDLVYSGFPYVVAMQEKITQAAARHFSQAFYMELQKGQDIDYAVAMGRSAIAAHLTGAIDWCLPVLYTNLGLPDKGSISQGIEWIEDWFRRPNAIHPIAIASFALGGAHLATGLQRWLQGTTLILPDAHLMLNALGWLVLAPLLVTWWLLRTKTLPVDMHWSRATYAAFVVRVFSAATVGIGLPLLYLVWFNVILLAGIGIWNLLPALVQVGVLEIFALGALLVSYAQAHSHGLGFITNAKVGDMPFAWSELFVVLAGYCFLAMPLWLFYPIPPWLLLPFLNINLVIGILTFVIAYFLLDVRR